MNQGDNVRLSFPEGTRPQFVDGTLDRVDEYRAAVAVDARLPDPLPEGRCMVDLLGSDATYRRMKRALAEVLKTADPKRLRLRDVFLGKARPASEKLPDIRYFDPKLNRWQREAVRRALAAKDVSLVHGPPGTGKTTVLVEIIRQSAARGERVLATAPSNIAVDNMLEKLLPRDGEEEGFLGGLRVVRLGHPARTLESLRHGTLRYQAAEDPQYVAVQEMDAWRERLARKLARTGRGRIVGREKGETHRELKRLWREARKIELAVTRRLALSAQVVLSTHGGITEHILRGEFERVILDEASQATEPLSWIPLLKGKKAVFAGDAHQLPPTLYSVDAAREGLSVTLFERLKGLLPSGLQTLLRVQYRMHETVMGFSSRMFYDGKLIADDSVRRHRACDLDGVEASDLTEEPLVFVDTAGTGYDESFNELLRSRENRGEAELAARIARQLLDAGLEPEDLAVLTPYVAQVKMLKPLLRVPRLEIGTVDGFQGREKEVTVISLVRSNERGEVGFLADTRRMNVAVTRARRGLIVIGDSATIAHHPFYRGFIDYAGENGSYRSAWEWMDG